MLLASWWPFQVTSSASGRRSSSPRADVPTVAPGVDVLAGIAEIPLRMHGNDYRRAAFGDAWTDDNIAPGGHNGCDTRNDVLDRDLVDKTYVAIKRCPDAVATGTLHDPYTNDVDPLHPRQPKVGAAVQIDHIVPLALAWDLGARDWPDELRHPVRQRPGQPDRGRRAGQSGQGRRRARRLDAAQPCVLVPVRGAVHRGAARLRPAGRPAVGGGAARRRGHLPGGLTRRSDFRKPHGSQLLPESRYRR